MFLNSPKQFCKINDYKNLLLFFYQFIGLRVIFVCTPFPLHNESSSLPVGWKLWEQLALKWPERSIFRRAVYTTFIIEKLIITHQEPILGIQVWILLGYPSNILGYPSEYCKYTSMMKLGWFPHSPQPPPVGNFFNIHLTKIIIEHKRSEI